MTALHLTAESFSQTVEITDWRSAFSINGQVAALLAVSLRQTPSVAKDDRLRHCLLGNDVAAFANPKFFFGTFHATSRNALSLTAHVAHTAVSNLLISLYCHSYPSLAHSKIFAQKTVFSRS
jgi:hypothetical protein